ncbi:MmcQ/YjbR family DNA-binding protein [Lentzea sp. NEAU-D7]|uniref:MmcQ/YjbR family DNA-binding protein n=1 Tax=Lentzea sp. NEAU-D7 TaxID=2994667 RepID=UPI00224A4EE2|nr:MmcQ/YjbR family DNA-binding protein [Lentzea sp. NEAU-D7]MCX2949308.1 MmcQ/YjbR family DNA-binding protein [Lentzea sp. NEAU-D7]
MTDRADVPGEVLDELRGICARLPESREEAAWVGTRWRIRKRTFLHVFTAHPGQEGAYSRAAELTEPTVIMTFRAQPEEFGALVGAGEPFFRAAWGQDVVGMKVRPGADWAEVGELLAESYRKLAPAKLARLVD